MPAPIVLPADTRRLLALARSDRPAAREQVDALSVQQQVALVCESPMARRREVLDLLSHPEVLVPELPEAELCYTVKAIGIPDAGWIVEHATTEQLVACVDLDAWNDLTPDPSQLGEWIRSAAEAGEETLLRLAHGLDMELLALWLAERIEVSLKTSDDDWEPPAGASTLDGQFYQRARHEKDDLTEVRALLDVLFRNDYWHYFRLLQAVRWEIESDCQEWALRWRSGRLQDLGFPTWDESMSIYGVLPARLLNQLPEPELDFQMGEWPLPVWIPRLQLSPESGHAIFLAFAELEEDQRRGRLYAFLALANQVAVADRLALGDAESIPAALEKAARVTSAGLEHLARAHGVGVADVVRRTSLEHLFRVGWTLSGERPPFPPGDLDEAEDPDETA